jgi:hypothetical protein
MFHDLVRNWPVSPAWAYYHHPSPGSLKKVP